MSRGKLIREKAQKEVTFYTKKRQKRNYLFLLSLRRDY